MIFMSDGKSRRQKRVTGLASALSLHCSEFSGTSNASHWLGKIFREYETKWERRNAGGRYLRPNHTVRPMVVYVFTDGVWEGTCRVGPKICDLIQHLKGADEHQVGVQFIQFGRDQKGTRRLRYLDEGLVATGKTNM